MPHSQNLRAASLALTPGRQGLEQRAEFREAGQTSLANRSHRSGGRVAEMTVIEITSKEDWAQKHAEAKNSQKPVCSRNACLCEHTLV